MTLETLGNTIIVHLPEELDHHNSRMLLKEVEVLVRRQEIKRLVFDYTYTRFMDSAGVGAILSQYRQLERKGGSIRIYGTGYRARRLLEMAGIPKLARICATREEALAPDEEEKQQ